MKISLQNIFVNEEYKIIQSVPKLKKQFYISTLLNKHCSMYQTEENRDSIWKSRAGIEFLEFFTNLICTSPFMEYYLLKL